ncbi:hypothetical protein ZIOFF_045835 [Zingiber officinale]|uniref:Uncharacterized protein n=1 Tax=Zingiber officinale TaxID=94328 RepID=A0A8J5G8G4_ZINOF|nr:hypothetical protein ZIOFF_045835 [Zingiber officinale]
MLIDPDIVVEGGGGRQHEGREVLFIPISRCSPGPSSAAAASPLLLLLIAWRSLVEFGSPSGNITRKAPPQSVPRRCQWSLSFSPSPPLITVCSTAATTAAGSHRCLLPRPQPLSEATATFPSNHRCSCPLPRLLSLSLVDIVTFQVAVAWYYLGNSGHRAECVARSAILTLVARLLFCHSFDVLLFARHRAGYRLDPLSAVAISCDTIIIATAHVTLYNGLSDLTLVMEGGGGRQHEGREVLFLPISRCSPGPSPAAAASPLLLLLISWRSLVEFGSPSGNITRKAPPQSVPRRRQWLLSFSPSPPLIAVCSTAATVAIDNHRCLLPRPQPPSVATATFPRSHRCLLPRPQPPLASIAAFSRGHSRRRQPQVPPPASTAAVFSGYRHLPCSRSLVTISSGMLSRVSSELIWFAMFSCGALFSFGFAVGGWGNRFEWIGDLSPWSLYFPDGPGLLAADSIVDKLISRKQRKDVCERDIQQQEEGKGLNRGTPEHLLISDVSISMELVTHYFDESFLRTEGDSGNTYSKSHLSDSKSYFSESESIVEESSEELAMIYLIHA